MPLRSHGADPEVRRFSAPLRRLDEAAFADFVTDVWKARRGDRRHERELFSALNLAAGSVSFE